MNWAAFAKTLREESNRDINRSVDVETIQRDPSGAMTLRISAIVCNRIAKAIEAAIESDTRTEVINEIVVESAQKAAQLKKPRKKRTGFVRDLDFKPHKR